MESGHGEHTASDDDHQAQVAAGQHDQGGEDHQADAGRYQQRQPTGRRLGLGTLGTIHQVLRIRLLVSR